ncbi:MAG: HAMP domain-containing histidine kinase [Oscillospiraceae bacterium]|nr:HAMP domain-containing histidine kinase [Oscillospiraceae bacterium]
MTHSIRFKFILFILAILLVLLLLLNTYPITSSRDAVFQEKRSSLSGQAAVVSSALGSLERLTPDGVSDVFRFLEISSFDRIVVIGETGNVVFDDGHDAPELDDLRTALEGRSVFRSVFANASFSSSVSVPIGTQNALIGAVALYESDTERAGIILSIQQRIVILSLVIGIFAILLALLFSWLILRRLYALTRSMNIVAGGDYTHRHVVSGNDELSELGREFNALTEQLELNESQRRRFVSDASHELKTPLASIRLLSDSILQAEQMDADTMREFVADIRTEAGRLQRTTEKLLDLSRLDDGVKVVPEPVDLKQVTLDALSALTPLARDRNVRLDSALDDGCVIMGSADDMAHVIFNLAENAIKYNVPDGTVMIRLSQDADTVTLTVEDTGIGIPEEDRLNIFTRFYRVDKARSRASGGSGLGLSIVHDAVIAHGGSIRVGNNKPQGSVFIVSFPRPTLEEIGI